MKQSIFIALLCLTLAACTEDTSRPSYFTDRDTRDNFYGSYHDYNYNANDREHDRDNDAPRYNRYRDED